MRAGGAGRGCCSWLVKAGGGRAGGARPRAYLERGDAEKKAYIRFGLYRRGRCRVSPSAPAGASGAVATSAPGRTASSGRLWCAAPRMAMDGAAVIIERALVHKLFCSSPPRGRGGGGGLRRRPPERTFCAPRRRRAARRGGRRLFRSLRQHARASGAWSTSAPLSRACRPPLACSGVRSAALAISWPPPSPRPCR